MRMTETSLPVRLTPRFLIQCKIVTYCFKGTQRPIKNICCYRRVQKQADQFLVKPDSSDTQMLKTTPLSCSLHRSKKQVWLVDECYIFVCVSYCQQQVNEKVYE